MLLAYEAVEKWEHALARIVESAFDQMVDVVDGARHYQCRYCQLRRQSLRAMEEDHPSECAYAIARDACGRSWTARGLTCPVGHMLEREGECHDCSLLRRTPDARPGIDFAGER